MIEKERHEAAASARAFEQQRRRQDSALAQDYCELIADLIERRGQARPTDIARHLGVSHATVANAVARLQRDGYVAWQPYRPVELTETGRRLALESRRRHGILLRFLESLGIDPETARHDAEGMEHHVSEATLEALQRFIEGDGLQRCPNKAKL